MLRRLPVYILADTSGSMEGESIESVKQGIRSLHANLMGDPSAIETACLSVITFDDEARQLVPLTEISDFVPPYIDAGGHTALGDALRLLMERIEVEVRRTGNGVKGDWRPLVFLLTDGAPDDDWRPYAREFKLREPGDIIAVACGEHASIEALKEITSTVLHMRELTPESFSQFFKWISSTVTQAGRRPDQSFSIDGAMAMPPPPPEIMLVP